MRSTTHRHADVEVADWFEGVHEEWRAFKHLYCAAMEAGMKGDQHTERLLRRRFFRIIRSAIPRARFKGRLLGALGDATLRLDLRLALLLDSYRASLKDGDLYNCLVTAESLAEFYVESRPNAQRARHWLAVGRRLLGRFYDRDLEKDLNLLAERNKAAVRELK